jgi:predicted amidohydrolase YtcJ
MRILSALVFATQSAFAGFAQAESVSFQDLFKGVPPAPQATIYVARDIITMDPDRPRAEAVAVVGDKIAAVGSAKDLKALAKKQGYRVDETFADKVLIAGFVEQHVHPLLTALTMTSNVISIEDWDTTRGFSAAVRDEEGYRARLKEALAAHKNDETFFTWGYHHYFHGDLSRAILDEMAPDIPVIVWHRSCHEFILNTKALEKYKIDEAFIATFRKTAQEQSNFEKGHFYEQGMEDVLPRLGPALVTEQRMTEGLEYSKDYYLRNGITIAAEPGGFLSKPVQDLVNRSYGGDQTPFNHYFIPDGKTLSTLHLRKSGAETMIAETRKLLEWGSGRARFLPQQVKLFTDGAIYSQLMMMKDGYTDGHHGAWIMNPDIFSEAFQAYWDAGYQIHIHNNGDLGMDVLLSNVEQALRRNPRFDHRTTVVHFGQATTEQIERAARMGVIVSGNPYYVTALAGRYKDFGLGPERSARIAPFGDAMRAGTSISFHSDMPMAPAKPLMLAWAAVTRMTAEGEVAGPDQVVDVETALKAITIEAAYSIQLEKEVGSIEPGKYANFTVLEQNPFDVEPDKLRDIPVWGTVFEGRKQPAPKRPAKDARLDNGHRHQTAAAGRADDRIPVHTPGAARSGASDDMAAYRISLHRYHAGRHSHLSEIRRHLAEHLHNSMPR